MWEKLGRVFTPELCPWAQSHAAVPTVEDLGSGFFRVYLAARNGRGLSEIASYVFHGDRPHEVVEVASRPVLDLGPLGAFDDCAVFPSHAVAWNGRTYLYYVGWTQGRSVPFLSAIGLAVSEDKGATFRRASPAPLLGRSPSDPYFTATCFVQPGTEGWRMWYTSGLGWDGEHGDARPRYHLKQATSPDGLSWTTDSVPAIDLGPGEVAITRPWVAGEGPGLRMWFSYRGPHYRIGSASSADGRIWRREDGHGLDVSDTGWDAEMVEYSAIYHHGGQRFMLYNGNGSGRSGIGLAVWTGSLENAP